MKRRERIVRMLQAQGPEMVQMPRELHERAVRFMEKTLAERAEDRERIEFYRRDDFRKTEALTAAHERIETLERRHVARTGFIAVLLAMLIGLLVFPMIQWAEQIPFQNAFTTCVEVYDEIEPDGVFREDLDRHYDNEGRCHLIVAYYGEAQFIENFSDPTRVDEIRTIQGE